MDQGALQATGHVVAELDVTERLTQTLKGKETPLCILICPERIYSVVIKNQGFWN